MSILRASYVTLFNDGFVFFSSLVNLCSVGDIHQCDFLAAINYPLLICITQRNYIIMNLIEIVYSVPW